VAASLSSSDHTAKEYGMTLNSEQIVRKAYQIAEDMDLTGWVAAFTEDGTFTDESIGVTYRGPDELPVQVENYKRAFPDMHRELYQMYVSGNIVVVQLALQGTDGHRVLASRSARSSSSLRCSWAGPC
jgi:ketosteroid isomerase-like protein